MKYKKMKIIKIRFKSLPSETLSAPLLFKKKCTINATYKYQSSLSVFMVLNCGTVYVLNL